MKRLVVCVHWHNAPWDPSEFFPVADKVSARLAELGGRRLTWGADRYAFDFEPEQFDEVVQVVMRILTELPGHSVGMALRSLAFRQAHSGSLRACGLALALAEALAVAAGAGEALVDPEIDYHNSGLRKIGVIDVERFDLSLRAATLIPGPSSIQGFFDVPVLPRPSRAPGFDGSHDARPTPAPMARGPVSKPPLRAATPSRMPLREGGVTATPRPAPVRTPLGARVPHPPRPGATPPLLVRPSAAPPPLKRPSMTPRLAPATARASEIPPPPSMRAPSLDAEETMPPPSVRTTGASGAEAVASAPAHSDVPTPSRTRESGEVALLSADRSSQSGERPSVNPPQPWVASPRSSSKSEPSATNEKGASGGTASRSADSRELPSVRALSAHPASRLSDSAASLARPPAGGRIDTGTESRELALRGRSSRPSPPSGAAEEPRAGTTFTSGRLRGSETPLPPSVRGSDLPRSQVPPRPLAGGSQRPSETPLPPSTGAAGSSQPGTLPPPSVRLLPPRPSATSASGEMPSVRPSTTSRHGNPAPGSADEKVQPESVDDLVEELDEVETIEVSLPRSAPPPPSRRPDSARAANPAADRQDETPAKGATDTATNARGSGGEGDEVHAAAASLTSAATTHAAGAHKNKNRKRRRRRGKGGQGGPSPG